MALARRRAGLVAHRWTWLRQVHAGRVVVVEVPGGGAGQEADAAVTAVSDAVLAVHAADCAPIALVAEGGAVAVAHAGWRGLAAGVVAGAVDGLTALAAGPIRALVGPVIGPECYEFGEADLQPLRECLGDAVVGTTSWGTPALDLSAGVRAALDGCGVRDVTFLGGCTACGEEAFSAPRPGRSGPPCRPGLDRGGVSFDVASVAGSMAAVRERIADAGGDPGRITVVAVTKGFGPEAPLAALGAGIVDLGENYAQELVAKAAVVGEDPAPVWHFIGGLQRNKVRMLVPHVALWETIDRASLGAEVAKRAAGCRGAGPGQHLGRGGQERLSARGDGRSGR